MLTFASWNMHQRQDAWPHLAEMMRSNDVAVALVQEAKRPEVVQNGLVCHPPTSDPDRWRISVPRYYRKESGELAETRRWCASACVSSEVVEALPREAAPLNEVADGELASSHPGQFAVVDLQLASDERVTLVSLYGIWDRMSDSRDLYSEATLHRAISDLAVVFQRRAADNVLVAGDLNLYDYSDGSPLAVRAATVFERLKTYGLEVCGPFRADGEQRLEGCPCPDLECRHVQTYLHQSNPANRKHQLDFFLATPALRERLMQSWADPDPTWYEHSDHRMIFASFEF